MRQLNQIFSPERLKKSLVSIHELFTFNGKQVRVMIYTSVNLTQNIS